MNVSVTSEPTTLRQQVNILPTYVLASWRSRYVPVDGVDLEARAMLNQEAAVVRADGVQPDALTVWMRLADQVVRVGLPSPELIAAVTLAGLGGLVAAEPKLHFMGMMAVVKGLLPTQSRPVHRFAAECTLAASTGD